MSEPLFLIQLLAVILVVGLSGRIARRRFQWTRAIAWTYGTAVVAVYLFLGHLLQGEPWPRAYLVPAVVVLVGVGFTTALGEQFWRRYRQVQAQLIRAERMAADAQAQEAVRRAAAEMERQMYEAERLSSLGLLSASIAHEVRNPLSAIKAIASVLREDLRDHSGATEDLSVILGEIDRLDRVVDRLLKFARPDEEQALRTVSLKGLLDDIVLILAHEAERRNIAIHSDVDEGVTVLGNPEGIKEIFFNLILNGIQAMEGESGGEVTLTARPVLPGQEDRGRPVPPSGAEREGGVPLSGSGAGWVEVAVADTGPGIPEHVRKRIFEPFYTTKASGTGLGLAIVRRDIERMGGSIDVAEGARHGYGAAFTVRLPGGDNATENPDRG